MGSQRVDHDWAHTELWNSMINFSGKKFSLPRSVYVNLTSSCYSQPKFKDIGEDKDKKFIILLCFLLSDLLAFYFISDKASSVANNFSCKLIALFILLPSHSPSSSQSETLIHLEYIKKKWPATDGSSLKMNQIRFYEIPVR